MKNILLATDFSSPAHKAALCAGEIAYCLNARLIVFSALPPVVGFREAGVIHDLSEAEEVVQKKLDLLAHELRDRFNVSVTRLLKPGFPEDEIPTLAERLNAALVLVGARGESASASKTMGKVAKEIHTKCPCPVICVPPEELTSLGDKTNYIKSKGLELCNPAGLLFLEEFHHQLTSGVVMPKFAS